jgi:hypothetical protein
VKFQLRQKRNRQKVKHFCETSVNLTRLKNGFMLITSKFDRNAAHLSEDRNTVEISTLLILQVVVERKIFLFDDIYTQVNHF